MDASELSQHRAVNPEQNMADWVARAQAGDRDAFDRLAQASLKRLRAVVRRLVGDAAETDDLVQDTLLSAWTSLNRFRGDAQFST